MPDEKPPPRKQTDPTLAIDRDKLPPVASALIERAAAFYPELPPDLIVTDPADAEDMPPTQVACPSCQRCPSCGGTHLVTIEQRSALLRKETGL